MRNTVDMSLSFFIGSDMHTHVFQLESDPRQAIEQPRIHEAFRQMNKTQTVNGLRIQCEIVTRLVAA